MKNLYKTLAGLFGAVFLAALFVPNAIAQCGGIRPTATHASWNYRMGGARLVQAAEENDAGIVGFWHVKFVSDGVTSGIPGGLPKGAEVDAGYSQWHSDGTEIMNSGGRAPNTGDFCLGVWSKTGDRTYKLNHFAAAWDPTKGPVGPAGPAGEIIGPARIQEQITLAPDGESFAGYFTIDQYDESATLLVHIQGSITGSRIHVDTPATSVF